MKDNDFYWYWFANIPGIGLKTRKKLLDYFAHPRYVYEASDSEIKVFLTKRQWERFPFSKNREKSEKEVQRLQEEGIFFNYICHQIYYIIKEGSLISQSLFWRW